MIKTFLSVRRLRGEVVEKATVMRIREKLTRSFGMVGAVLISISSVACGGDSPTAPPPPPRFSVSITAPQSVSASRNGSAWECRFQATIQATGGTSSQFATLTRVFMEARRPNGTVFTSGLVNAVEYWGSDRVNYRSQLRSGNWGWRTLPVRQMQLVGTYNVTLPSGENQSFTVFVNCT